VIGAPLSGQTRLKQRRPLSRRCATLQPAGPGEFAGHTRLAVRSLQPWALLREPQIEAALQITGDNRATAAEMLGLSRQSLYAKLRRYGPGDLAAEE